MKVVNFTQGSDEWLAWRRNGVGASDMGVIMGSSPYQTPLELWEIKCGYRNEDAPNAAMNHGILNEDKARQWINSQYGLNLKAICIEDNERGEFRASLDGYDTEKEVLCEIKCPVSEKILEGAHKTQSVPAYWIDQIQWQILLSQPKRAFLAIWDYRHNSCIVLEMFGHTNQMEKMRIEANKFWTGVQMGLPPAPKEKDYIELSDPELKELLVEYDELRNSANAFKELADELRVQILSFGDGGNFKCGKFRVKKNAPRVGYDYQKMKADGVPIENYIKESNSEGFYTILRTK